MNKQDLVSKIAKKTGVTKKDTDKVLGALVEGIREALAKKDKVALVGFGSFSVKHRAARTGRNPQTGAAIKIAATTVPVFRAGKALKEAVAKKAAKKKK